MGGWDIDDACPPLTQESWDKYMVTNYKFTESRITETDGDVFFDGLITDGKESLYIGFNMGLTGADAFYRARDHFASKKSLKIHYPDVDVKFENPIPYKASIREFLPAEGCNYNRPSWTERNPWQGNDSLQFVYFGGMSHSIYTLMEAGWSFEYEINRFTNKRRLVGKMPNEDSSVAGRWFSHKFHNEEQLEATFKYFVPNTMHEKMLKKVRLEIPYIDIDDVPTEQLMDLLTERLKNETPKSKKPKQPPHNPAVLDFLSAFEERNADTEDYQEAVNE